MEATFVTRFIKFNIGLLISLVFSNSASSQEFERFSNAEGFNQNTVTAIEQDNSGFLWFATPNGLFKYDGYEFINSNFKNNLTNNKITSLHNDSNGVLWIGTQDGLNVYIPWLERFYKVNTPPDIHVTHIDSDPDGRVWVSGSNELFSCEVIDVNKGVILVNLGIIKSDSNISFINKFYFKDKSSILLATTKGVVMLRKQPLLAGEEKVSYEEISFPKFKRLNVTSLLRVDNIYWVGYSKGLYKAAFEGDKLYVIDEFSQINVKTLFEDNNQSVWIGTNDNGLFKYIPKKESFVHYKYNPKNDAGISSEIINCIYQDNFNVLWIGTAHGGINKLDLMRKKFINYSHNPFDPNSISGNLTTSILEDSKGYLWVSSFNKSIVRSIEPVSNSNINTLKFKNVSNSFPLEGNDIIASIYEDDKGFIWFGTYTSLVVLNPKTNKFKKIELTKNNKKIGLGICSGIIQFDKTKMILGGDRGVVLINPWDQIDKNIDPVIEVNSIIPFKGKKVNTLLKDGYENLWFGTDDGLLKGVFRNNEIIIQKEFNSNKFENLKISHSNIFSLHLDDKGVVWVGTFGGGLNKLITNELGEVKTIEVFNKNNLLPDNAVYGILQESNDHLWMSTDMGLIKFDSENKLIDVFDVRDGLAYNNFRKSSYYKGNSGYFYFGGLKGLTVFKPESIATNILPPKVVITDLYIKNKIVSIGEKINGKIILEESISETENIEFNQTDQFISIGVAVQHYSTPSKNRLAYKLEGFNNEWVEKSAGKTVVSYTNLLPGKYVFKVRGTNGDGVWGDEIKSLNIEVFPPWYKTWWSFSIIFIIILVFTIGVSFYFIQHEKLKQRVKYEEKDKERLKNINQGKFRFFTNISHEFRTPLTLIAGPLELVLSQNKNAEIGNNLAIIQKNTKRLLNLLDQLISFRQVEQGHTNLKLRLTTLGNFMYPVAEAFEHYALEKSINFFYKINSPNEDIILDIEKSERIFFNLLSNSFKHTPKNGNISIEADIEIINNEKQIKIEIIDTGKGIPKDNLKNIFERFYQLDNEIEKTESGGGIGLAFCKALLDLMKGEIYVSSQPNIETRFTVVIPVNNIAVSEVSRSEKSFIKNWIPLTKTNYDENIVTVKETEKSCTILVVEDEIDIQNFLLNTLSKKYNVLIVNNGIEALETIKLKEPDLVISDVMMPEMDGFELCESIKSNDQTCHIPVLLLTALTEDEDVIKGLEFGADEYISKPFSLKHLKLRIEKLIENNIRLKSYFSKKSTLPEKGIEMNSRNKDFLSKIIKKTEQNLSDSNFGVEELANEIGLSPSQFYRKLKQLTGQVPNVYLRNYRLQRAAELLQSNEGFNVADVMYQIGIESHSYFSTSFKKLYGVSPSQYITKN